MGNEQPTDSDDESIDEQKVRRSIYIPVEVTEWADNADINLSGLASRLLEKEMARRKVASEYVLVDGSSSAESNEGDSV